MRLTRIFAAAALVTAAAVFLTGCATKRDVSRVEERVVRLQAGQSSIEARLKTLDSLIAADSEESVKLRAEIRQSVDDLMEQFRVIQANLSDFQDRLGYALAAGQQQSVVIAPPQDTSASSTAPDTTMPTIKCQELYDESFINIRREKYEEGIKGFQDYLKYCGTLDLADDARFWIGEAYYSMEDYQQAISQFDTLINTYSSSEKRPAAIYKMARSQEELGRKSDAKKSFQRLIDDYPDTFEAAQAKEKLKEL